MKEIAKILQEFKQENKIDFVYCVDEIKEFLSVFRKWNKQFRFSTYETEKEIFVNNILDSFALDAFLKQERRFVDLGSGAGFPGLSYKLINKEITLVSVERNAKKIHCQKEITAKINLQKVFWINENFKTNLSLKKEELFVVRAPDNKKDFFDWVKDNIKEKKYIFFGMQEKPSFIKGYKTEKEFIYKLPGHRKKRCLYKIKKQ